MASANPYKLFDVILHRKTLLSPHMMRITLASPAVKEMATWAPDQRVKLFFLRLMVRLPGLLRARVGTPASRQ